jgi:hypothetical protein
LNSRGRLGAGAFAPDDRGERHELVCTQCAGADGEDDVAGLA